jgi:GMP reductase
MRIISELKIDFKDVLIVPKRSDSKSRDDVLLQRRFTFLHSGRSWTGIPIMISNMDATGTFAMAQVMARKKILTCIHKFYSISEWSDFLLNQTDDAMNFFVVSVGISTSDINKLHTILALDDRLTWICLDVANGYTEQFVEKVREIRTHYPNHIIVAGNVVTGEMTEELLLSGADIVKCGIGSGSVCTTRLITGVGYPQLSAVIECGDSAHGLKGQIASDGGCTNSGDIAKAFGGGADFVMLGGMMAGHDESGGTIIEENDTKYKEFYGMSSSDAMLKYYGTKASYRASEGKRVLVPYRGPVSNTIDEILGGIRSTCTYVGALSLKELSKRTTFIRVNQQANDIFK